MRIISVLAEALAECLSDWDSQFSVDISQHEEFKCWHYFDVTVKHEVGKEYSFRARCKHSGEAEMDYHEDSWQSINKANLFVFMWFDEALRK